MTLSLGERPCFGWSHALVQINWHNEPWAWAQPAMGPWSSLSLPLFLSECFPLSLNCSLHQPLIYTSLASVSFSSFSPPLLFISSLYLFSSLKKSFGLLPVFLTNPTHPSPPINAWMVFYVKLTLIRVISAPSSFYLPLNPASSPLAPLPKISVSCRPNKRSEGEIKAKRMLPTSLPRMNESILLHFPEIF